MTHLYLFVFADTPAVCRDTLAEKHTGLDSNQNNYTNPLNNILIIRE